MQWVSLIEQKQRGIHNKSLTYHLVKRKHAVPWLKFGHVGTDLMDDAGDIIARVHGLAHPFWDLPVLWIGAADRDLDDDLIVIWLRDGRVHDGHLRACVYNC